MAFTVKSIFPHFDFPGEVMNQHRMNVGMRVRDSWNARYDTFPSKIEEDGCLVNQYPDEFKEKACSIIKKYVVEKALNLPKADPKKKRPRIRLEPVYQH